MSTKMLTAEQAKKLNNFMIPYGFLDKECCAEAAIRIIESLQNELREAESKITELENELRKSRLKSNPNYYQEE